MPINKQQIGENGARRPVLASYQHCYFLFRGGGQLVHNWLVPSLAFISLMYHVFVYLLAMSLNGEKMQIYDLLQNGCFDPGPGSNAQHAGVGCLLPNPMSKDHLGARRKLRRRVQ